MFRPTELDKVIDLIEGNIAGVLTPLVMDGRTNSQNPGILSMI